MLDKSFNTKKAKNKLSQKIFLTLVCLFLFRLGNLIPLAGIDQEALSKSLSSLDQNNYLIKVINMYSTGGSKYLSIFSLGIIPYINASILIDLLTTFLPSLEKLQSEEGESGKRRLAFYKKGLTILIAGVQSVSLLTYIKGYFYIFDYYSIFSSALILIMGSMSIIFISSKIDSKGIGNGSSLIILTNILLSILNNQILFSSKNFLEIIFLLFFAYLILILQKQRLNIALISARQLSFLQENKEVRKKYLLNQKFEGEENGLVIKLNQAGIFPIIIASNLMAFFSFINFSKNFEWLNYLFYQALIITFNYFYTLIFWDPEKISKQLSKSSVSILAIAPGPETISYLQKQVQSTSLLGGLYLSLLLVFYDSIKNIFNFSLLNQLNVSSLIIAIGISYEVQKNLFSLYQSLQDQYIEKR
jgi:preprotein translocase subunit SecY